MAQLQRRKEKLQRRELPLEKFTEHFHNWGGFMPFPPLTCNYLKNVFAFRQPDGIVKWIDNGICNGKCKAKCDRWTSYWKGGGKEEHVNFVMARTNRPTVKGK